jgi:hypothetical protein
MQRRENALARSVKDSRWNVADSILVDLQTNVGLLQTTILIEVVLVQCLDDLRTGN